MSDPKNLPRIDALSPILAVPDVLAAVNYYTAVLGFDRDFLWQDPPTHGAVRRDKIQIQFGLNPDLARRAAGTQYFLFVTGVEEFHSSHVGKGAQIISPIENKPWGLREYTVSDLNGYQFRFAGPEKFERPQNALDALPPHIQIEHRLATPEEHFTLTKSVNWGHNPATIGAALANSLHGVVAIDISDPAHPHTVGMLRILGDGAQVFIISDVVVKPSHQNQRIGASMMESALTWIRDTAPPGAFVGLFTLKPGFYETLGFKSDFAMHLKT
jgi:uncharacterized glyoxalase superfamily protein PhnB/GNAT superfamily N-acetyltransferase